MSTTVAKYTFSSWLRKGIGAKINEVDNLGLGSSSVKERASVPADIQINGQPIHKDFTLLGPGDAVGINPSMIVRHEPPPANTNFEPNYLTYIEFYDEDLAWRFTPARANGARLRPWITLLVLKDNEFKRDPGTQPLGSITILKAAALPLHHETWAWAHAHVNEGHASTNAFEQFLKSLHDPDNANADKITCRLMCPRRLEPDTGYTAFVVPVFETGRLAGLGQDPKDVDAQAPAWDATHTTPTLPVFHEWSFRTGRNEDFESLVNLLEPRVVDPRVGVRDIDGSKPGFGLTQPAVLGAPTPATAPPSIFGLEGALRAPTSTARPATLDPSRPFFGELESVLNFPAALRKASNAATDPIVSPPIYGENHALRHEVDVKRADWLDDLNRDPRHRAAAGFGTRVIQAHQERFMARAWAQVQRILDANRKLLYGAFSMHVTEVLQKGFTHRLDASRTLLLFGPVLKKVKGSPTTLFRQVADSRLTTAAVSPAMRRIIRPRGAVARRLRADDARFSPGRWIDDLNEGRVSAAPPKQPPQGVRDDAGVAAGLPSAHFPPWLVWLIRHRLLVLIILLLLALLLWLLAGAATALAVAFAAVALERWLARLAPQLAFAAAVTDPGQATMMIEAIPPRPDFALIETDASVIVPAAPGTTTTSTLDRVSGAGGSTVFTTQTWHTPAAAGSDSVEARKFRAAALIFEGRLGIEVPVVPRPRFDLANAHTKLIAATDARSAFPRQLAAQVHFSFNPTWLQDPEHLVPAMAYPDFEDPMYAPLRDISPELLLPNLNLIQPNTITLLETHPPFIESYMVGLNHEFGKELLWREFPTDTRPSSFRQFWDVKGLITAAPQQSAEQLAEAWKDISPIDTWTSQSTLGTHSRQQAKKNLVLAVRGELLKRYPRTIIYAQRAHLYKDAGTGTPRPERPPVILEVQTEAQMTTELRFPIFRAEIEPDYRFFGFPLTIEEARGDEDPRTDTDDWGWYFVIQQIPGEPRFGMDIAFDPDDDPSTPLTWNDLAWDRYPSGKAFIEAATRPTGFTPAGPDAMSQWGQDSALMAYILYQKPVMIAVHAREMLAGLAP